MGPSLRSIVRRRRCRRVQVTVTTIDTGLCLGVRCGTSLWKEPTNGCAKIKQVRASGPSSIY
jgi:hypothetical protein